MNSFDVLSVLILILSSALSFNIREEICDRRPTDSITDPLPPDNRFAIDIIGVTDEYIPDTEYTVRLYSTNNQSTFKAFTISAKEDEKENEKNPRKPVKLHTGRIVPKENSIKKPICENTVIQSDFTPKTSIEVTWVAPSKGNKCVTLHAFVAVHEDVWYKSLSKKVCEDRRKSDDMMPTLNDDCQVCEEARYQLIFEGMWSYNTHPSMFPKSMELARFSDVVGASHSNDFNVWKYNNIASSGLKMLAEQGNTTVLELEIQEGVSLGNNVRTLIKASRQPKPYMTTSATFRVSRQHHLVSLVAGILPSPDWFLGVANLELCSASTGTWAKNVVLNLYPMDAGTDSGATFESPNDGTSPPQPIETAVINKDIPKEQIKPFARLLFKLVQTYSTADCEDTNNSNDNEDYYNNYRPNYVNENQNPPPRITTTTTESIPVVDPSSGPDCPISEWEEWFSCDGECVNGKIVGMQTRLRYHVVDNVFVGKYSENNDESNQIEIPKECEEGTTLTEVRDCEEPCGDNDTNLNPPQPGENW